jgi:hypothetical protein
MQGDAPTSPRIRDDLGFLSTPLTGVGIDTTIEQERRSAVAEYMLRRHTFNHQAPLVVVSGLTGSGVSTVVNSLARAEVSETGVRRPTTSAPVIVVAANDLDAPEASLVLAIDGTPRVVEVADAPFTIVDTPAWEMGSNGEVAARLIPMADVVVHVTTPGRYADVGGWRLIESAVLADVPVVIVLNRATDGPLADLQRRVTEVYGTLGPKVIAGIDRDQLIAIINLSVAEAPVRTVERAKSRLHSVVERIAPLVEEGAVLRDTVDVTYGELSDELVAELEAGGLVGPASLPTFTDASFDLATIVTARVGLAAERSAIAWAATPIGAEAVASDSVGLWRHGTETTTLTQRHVAETIDDIRSVARETTRWRRPSQRRLSTASDYLWRAALGDDRPTWLMRRAFGDRREESVARVRQLFSEAVARVFNADRQRFLERLHHIPTPDSLEALRLSLADEAQRSMTASTSGFEITIDISDGADLLEEQSDEAVAAGKTALPNDA